jgi:thiamine biosynthesis lipoprotein ApbE
MDFLLDLLLLAVVFWLGKKYQTWMFIADIYRDPDHYLELAKKVKETKAEIESQEASMTQDSDDVEVRAETVNDTVYIYDSQTGEFLAQAQNIYQASVLAAARYPNKRFRINPKL